MGTVHLHCMRVRMDFGDSIGHSVLFLKISKTRRRKVWLSNFKALNNSVAHRYNSVRHLQTIFFSSFAGNRNHSESLPKLYQRMPRTLKSQIRKRSQGFPADYSHSKQESPTVKSTKSIHQTTFKNLTFLHSSRVFEKAATRAWFQGHPKTQYFTAEQK